MKIQFRDPNPVRRIRVVPPQNLPGPVRRRGDQQLIHGQDRRPQHNPHPKIGRGQAPQAHSRRAHRRQLLMAAVIGQGVKQRQQKRHRNDHRHQKFRQRHHIILGQVAEVEVLFLKTFDAENQIECHIKNQEAAQTIGQRHEQFPQQIPVQQTHRRHLPSGRRA